MTTGIIQERKKKRKKERKNATAKTQKPKKLCSIQIFIKTTEYVMYCCYNNDYCPSYYVVKSRKLVVSRPNTPKPLMDKLIYLTSFTLRCKASLFIKKEQAGY